MWLLVVIMLAALSGCSVVSGFGKREAKFEEPPAYLGVPAAPKETKPLPGISQESGESTLPWLMSDRAKEISRGIDSKH